MQMLDAVAARKVADFLATEHHEIYFSVEEGIKY
jgi:asparagine synthase (glutamine-hydrolysing)